MNVDIGDGVGAYARVVLSDEGTVHADAGGKDREARFYVQEPAACPFFRVEDGHHGVSVRQPVDDEERNASCLARGEVNAADRRLCAIEGFQDHETLRGIY